MPTLRKNRPSMADRLRPSDYDGIPIITPCCGCSIEFAAALLDDAATRCPACGEAVATSSLADHAYDAILSRVGTAPESEELSQLDPAENAWMMADGAVCGKTTLIDDHGLLFLPTAVPHTIAEEVRLEAAASLEAALALPPDRASDVLTAVREPTHRYDVRLEMTDAMCRLLRSLVASSTTAGRAVEGALGEHAYLCECSCIISEPGAPAQAVHCDTAAVGSDGDGGDSDSGGGSSGGGGGDGGGGDGGGGDGGSCGGRCGGPRLLTCFVALEDIDPAMGPTHVWPETHTPAFHRSMQEEGPLVFRHRRSVAIAPMRCGDCMLMDSRLWHCGGANVSQSPPRRRHLLVLSFGARGAFPDGSTYSLLSHLEGRYTLRSVRDGCACVTRQTV